MIASLALGVAIVAAILAFAQSGPGQRKTIQQAAAWVNPRLPYAFGGVFVLSGIAAYRSFRRRRAGL